MTAPTLPAGLDAHIAAMADLGARVEGHLTPREVRFLALLGAVPTCTGEVLEIGSYKGKSTVILARSAVFAGQERVCAVDPLDLPSATDPQGTAREGIEPAFRENLRAHGVEGSVEFYRMTSQQLGRTWDRRLRLLWIDGDHTFPGVRSDLDTFAPHLAPGAIVAFHDVLNWYAGPPRVMIEGPLASSLYGTCGMVGSIGWVQYLGDAAAGSACAATRGRLAAALRRLLPYAADDRPPGAMRRFLYKVQRARVPHAERGPAAWAAQVRFISS